MDRLRAKRINDAMKAARCSRDSLALLTGYSAGTISKIKAGGEIKSDQLIAICSVLQVSPNYVLGFNNHSAQAEILASRLSHAADDEIANLLLLILDKTSRR